MSFYYDRAGQPMTDDEWHSRFCDDAYCRVAEDHVEGFAISTVWTGIDYSFGFGEPLIFETIIFQCGCASDYQVRYGTEAQALVGHAAAVTHARELGAGATLDAFRGIIAAAVAEHGLKA